MEANESQAIATAPSAPADTAPKAKKKRSSTRKKKRSTKQTTGRPESRTAKTERPSRGTSRAAGRPERNARPIGDFRDNLGLHNPDPEKHYRWVLSTGDQDKRIWDALAAGWEFVDASQEPYILPGQYHVMRTDTDGSTYRVPAGRRVKDEWKYLMWMWEDEWQRVAAMKQDRVDATEEDLFRKKRPEDDDDKGQYSIRHEISTGEYYKRR